MKYALSERAGKLSRYYKTTRVWKNAFASSTDALCRQLEGSYDKAWDRGCALATRIASDASGLTLHDERHFEGLWRAIDLLVPETLALNAVEAFVLGVAILIHDAAHTTLAYLGGQKNITERPEWKDNVALLNRAATAPLILDESSRRKVLFETLRALHASEAPEILKLPFKHPAFGTDFYLIDDPSLRAHFGDIIGKVAASHHWDTAQLARFPRAVNIPAPYHDFSPMRPMFLAAIMRTSDAMQIDAQRASDFEFALANPTGVSRDHWAAQNRLAIGRDHDDSTALLINSTSPFGETEASAWWIAYELARNADKELRTTNTLLSDYSQPLLTLHRVKGVDDPQRFSEYVKTQGWIPIDAEIKIGDTARIVELFGGSGLYGRDVTVPLRELLQNSIDAVRARRAIDNTYAGKIWVQLAEATDSQGSSGFCLEVADDGIGMSAAILAGPFLTFGESGWTSPLLRRERPGFVGKGLTHIGRFGIGFFSVFMIGREVIVSSRPFESGLSDSSELHFKSGLGLRPLMRPAKDPSPQKVTTVRVFISAKMADDLLLKVGRDQKGRAHIEEATSQYHTLVDLVGVLCPAIDVQIETFDARTGARGKVEGNWPTGDGLLWLARINEGIEIPQVVAKNVDLLRLVGPPSNPTGRAALNPSPVELGLYSVGGLGAKKVAGLGRPREFFGSLDRVPRGPKRDPEFGEHGELSQWASEQVRLWTAVELTPAEQNKIAVCACGFGGDPAALANARVDNKWMCTAEIFDILLAGNSLIAPIDKHGIRPRDWYITNNVQLNFGMGYDAEDVVVEQDNLLTSYYNDHARFWSINDSDPNTLVGCIRRLVERNGKRLEVSLGERDVGYYSGPTRRYRTKGSRLIVASAELRLVL